MQQAQRTYPDYWEHVEALAEAIELQQIAVRSGGLWQALLDNARDQYIRRYFEGQIEISQLKALHHNLVAQSCQRAGHGLAHTSNPASERIAQNGICEPAVQAKPSEQVTHAKEGSDKTLIEWRTHDVKAEALALLADCCWTLRMENMARTYEARTRLEGATARGLNNVMKACDRKLEDLGGQEVAPKESADLQSSFRRLERAERNLKDYNLAHSRAMEHLRDARDLVLGIQKLEEHFANHSPKSADQTLLEEVICRRDMLAGLAEKEALAAVLSYRSFQAEIQSACKEYAALGRGLTGNSPEILKTSRSKNNMEKTDRTPTPQETKDNPESPGCTDIKTNGPETLTKELDPQNPEIQDDGSNPNQASGANQQLRNVAVSVVVGQMLRELDRGM